MKTENEISHEIIGMDIDIHRILGPGLFESVYENCLAYEGRLRGYEVEQQVPVPLVYKEVKLDAGFRIDIRFNRIVLVETKSVDAFAPIHEAQVLTYLKLSGIKLGLLINFNNVLLKDGIHRYVNNLQQSL